jgi:hypothetical protein
MSSLKPTTDLHYHVDAQTPAGILRVSNIHDLEFAGQSAEEIAGVVQVVPGTVDFKGWYYVHTRAREAVFVRPEVFKDVARAAVYDAECEKLKARVMRFSLSMPEFCFKSKHKRKPDYSDASDRKEFLGLLEAVTGNLIDGFASVDSSVKTPLVFSLSQTDNFLPILDDVVAVMLNFTDKIKGVDLTNEQLHRTAAFYHGPVKKLRDAGMTVLTVHVAEKYDERMIDEQGRILYTPEERTLDALALRPDLLGHATFAISSELALRAILARGVTVEVCPSSHMYGEPFASDPDICPLLVFRELGIPVTINSDTPGTIPGGCLAQEFALVKDRLGLSDKTLQAIDAYAWETFCRLYGD